MTLKQKLKAIRDRIHLRRRADIREAVEIAESLLHYKELYRKEEERLVVRNKQLAAIKEDIAMIKESRDWIAKQAGEWRDLAYQARESLSACLRYNEELQEENALLRCCREIQAPCYLRVNGKLRIYDVR